METRKLKEEKIVAIVPTLPEKALDGALVYMEKLRADTQDEALKTIHEMAGMFRGKLSSSEEFARRKAEEKKLDR